MKIHTMPQGSPDWFLHKRGKVGSGSMSRIITPARAEYSKQATSLMSEMIADLMLDDEAYVKQCLEGFMTRPMVDGKRLEVEAREYYSAIYGVDVENIGGVESECGRWWSSTDGMVLSGGEYVGALEIKAPLLKTHVAYMTDPDSLLMEYRVQVHGELLVTGLPWVDLISYGDGQPPVVKRVVPDEFTEKLRAALERFWTEYQATLARVREMGAVL